MDEGQVRERLAALTGLFDGFGVKSLSLFGSAVSGQTTESSDLDFLGEFEGAVTFERYLGLKEVLESEFKCPIDLVALRALKPFIRDQILGEAVKVA